MHQDGAETSDGLEEYSAVAYVAVQYFIMLEVSVGAGLARERKRKKTSSRPNHAFLLLCRVQSHTAVLPMVDVQRQAAWKMSSG